MSTRARIASLRTASLQPAGPLPPRIHQRLGCTPAELLDTPEENAPTLPWLKLVVRNRDSFAGTMFSFVGAHGVARHSALGHATQSPVFASFVRLEPSGRVVLALPGESFVHDPWCWWRRRFDVTERFDYTDEGVFQGELAVFVLVDAVKTPAAT